MLTQQFLSDEKSTHSSDWRSLIIALLGNPAHAIAVSEQKDTLKITTRDPVVVEKLGQMLESPEQLQAGLWYTIQPLQSPTSLLTSPLPRYPAASPFDQKDGLRIYRNLLTKKMRRRIGEFDWEEDENYTLKSSILKEEVPLSQEQLNTLVAYIKKLNYLQLRKVISNETNVLQDAEVIESKDQIMPLLPVLNEIIGMKHLENGSAIIYFNYGLLRKCLVPPKLSIDNLKAAQNSEGLCEITVEKISLINYLSTVTEASLLLEPVSSGAGDEKKIDRGRPILLRPLIEGTARRENRYILLIDCSESMISKFYSYIEKIKLAIKHLRTLQPSAIMHIIPFKNKNLHCQGFIGNVSEAEKISQFLDTLNASGRTYLYGPLANQLDQDNIYNTSIFIFTDGIDNESSLQEENLLKEKVIALTTQQKPPKVFIFGMGEELDEVLIKKLSAATDAVCVRGDTPSIFEELDQYLQKINTPSAVVFILEKIKEAWVSQKTRVFEGKPAVANFTVAVPGNLKIDGLSYTTHLAGASLLIEQEKKSDGLHSAKEKESKALPVLAGIQKIKRRHSWPTFFDPTITTPAIASNPKLEELSSSIKLTSTS
jgi:hypothetical protein